jgi:hypothetical protein
MKRIILTISLSLVICWFINPQVSAAHQRASQRTDSSYREIATYIANRILALKGKVAGFESISQAKNVHVKAYPFRPIVDYRHGVLRYEPVPESEPPMKQAVYADGGFTVAVWMVSGELTWKPSEPPVSIGEFKVAVDVGGPQRERIKPFIDRVVAEAAVRFNRKAQSNNGMHPTANERVSQAQSSGAAGDAGRSALTCSISMIECARP